MVQKSWEMASITGSVDRESFLIGKDSYKNGILEAASRAIPYYRRVCDVETRDRREGYRNRVRPSDVYSQARLTKPWCYLPILSLIRR